MQSKKERKSAISLLHPVAGGEPNRHETWIMFFHRSAEKRRP
jgi:hypothetical protein